MLNKVLNAAALSLCAHALSAQWSYPPSGTTAELRGVAFGMDGAIWASGARGTIVRSVDGGRTWAADTVRGATTLDFRSLWARDARHAVVASAGEAERGLARIFVTADSGRSWSQRFSSDARGIFLDAIAFRDSARGMALSDPVDGAFVMLETFDGGITWQQLPPGRMPRVLAGEAAFAASNGSLVVHGDRAWIGTGGSGRARIIRTDDGGVTWSVVEVPVHADGPAAGIFAIAFADSLNGIAVGGDYTKPALANRSVAMTSDGGRSWRASSAPPSAYLSGVAYAGSPARVVAVGLAGTFVSRDGGDTWTQTDTIALNAVRFRGTRGVAVGPRGRVGVIERLDR